MHGQRIIDHLCITSDLVLRASTAVAHVAYTYFMEISPRDRKIVELVARFRQISAAQVKTLLFDDVSRSMADRALRRLVDQQFLSRVERRTVGGVRGGSGVFVYVLGRRGYYQYFTGRFVVPRAVDYHCLAIVDAFIRVVEAERAGKHSIIAVSTEPECWRVLAGVELRPDLYVELQTSQGVERRWLEVDMGTEGQRQLRGKLEAYRRAYEDTDELEMPVFPIVQWVAVDAERKKELEWLISQMPESARGLFVVTVD